MKFVLLLLAGSIAQARTIFYCEHFMIGDPKYKVWVEQTQNTFTAKIHYLDKYMGTFTECRFVNEKYFYCPDKAIPGWVLELRPVEGSANISAYGDLFEQDSEAELGRRRHGLNCYKKI